MSKPTTRILGLVLAASVLAVAASAQTIKIGVIDSQKILENSVEGKRVIAQLEEKGKSLQAELTKVADQIRQLESKLSTQRLTLTEEAAAQITTDLDRKRTDQKRMAEDASREGQELQYRLFNKVQGELIPVIEAVGKEKGLDMIFDLAKSGAVYFNPAADLTSEVIRRYDATKAAPAK